jgi:NOL1/NOP2/fmu family ribosome biogenesis protein
MNLDKLKVNGIGLYFLTLEERGVRLSIDGSQIFKPKKNILELNKKQFEEWMSGKDLDLECEKGYWIMKHNDNFLGCGKSSGNKIIGFIPKERRVVFE